MAEPRDNNSASWELDEDRSFIQLTDRERTHLQAAAVILDKVYKGELGRETFLDGLRSVPNTRPPRGLVKAWSRAKRSRFALFEAIVTMNRLAQGNRAGNK